MPTDNESQRNNEFVKQHFPPFARFESVYLEREDGGDVLTPEAFDKALSIHNEILALEWSNKRDQDADGPSEDNPKVIESLPDTLALQHLCLNRTSGEGAEDVLDCSISNAVELFGCVASPAASLLLACRTTDGLTPTV